MDWQISLELDANAIRNSNPLPLLVQCITELQGLHNQRKNIYTVLAELYSNAVEHGLLNLDSRLKSNPSGFAEYYDLRTERLKGLERGLVRLNLRHSAAEDGGKLHISVQHSGTGFDPDELSEQECSMTKLCGRGIPLVDEICDSLIYEEGGRCAKAVLS